MNLRELISSAALTGVFCAVFAFVISQVAPMLTNTQILMTSFISGFLGTVVARMILRK